MIKINIILENKSNIYYNNLILLSNLIRKELMIFQIVSYKHILSIFNYSNNNEYIIYKM